MNAFRRLVILVIGYGCALTCAQAEHRVALVVGVDEMVPQLEKLGYRCQTSENLSEKELSRLVEGWTGTTPTNSTALFFFKGEVKLEEKEVQLVTSNDRSLEVSKIFELMRSRGGSADNRVVIESPTQPIYVGELPAGCSFGYAGEAELAPPHPPTIAISPPDKFVPGKKAGDEWVNVRGMVFCWCPPGKYTAGSPEGTAGRYDNEEQREVVIKDGFWIGKYEITKSQNVRSRGRIGENENKNEPLMDMHWDDGRPMASRTLTEEERKAGRLPSGWQYDLPLEGQWEYTARAGTSTLYFFGDDMSQLPEHGNFADKSFYDSKDIYSNHAHRTLDDGFVRVAPVGSFKANPWGLHDVYGNVYEWCRDHGARGGSWITPAENCRSGYRDHYSSRDNQIYLGYRFVIQPNVPDIKGKK